MSTQNQQVGLKSVTFEPKRVDFALSATQRTDARRALAILGDTGITLEEAAKRAVTGRRALDRVNVGTAADRFLLDRSRAGIRERTVEWYNDKIRLVVAAFGERTMDDVTRGEVIAWMGKLPGAEGSRAAAGRAARALWKWALQHDPQMVSQDITANLPMRSASNQGDAKILTVDQVERSLRTAAQYQSALALLLFAGIRPEEVHGRAKPPLLWGAINMDEHYIRVPADISKTGKPRIVDSLPPTIWGWLTPLDAQLPVSPARTHQIIMHCKRVLGVGAWSHDVTRHTFASYALAHTSDPGKVAHWLGHEGVPSLLHRTYRGLATKTQADLYFALKR